MIAYLKNKYPYYFNPPKASSSSAGLSVNQIVEQAKQASAQRQKNQTIYNRIGILGLLSVAFSTGNWTTYEEMRQDFIIKFVWVMDVEFAKIV